MKGYQKGLWRVPGLKELRKKNESEGQKKAKTSGERRPMAGAAMLVHLKELSLCIKFTYLPKVLELAVCKKGIHVAGGAPKRKYA